MSTITIRDGDLAIKNPSDVKVYVVDWDGENLAATATIMTSTWTIIAIRPSSTDVALTKDNETVLTAAAATLVLERTVTLDNRATQVRLLAGTLGQTYGIANEIVTNESPSQTKKRSFQVLVQQP